MHNSSHHGQRHLELVNFSNLDYTIFALVLIVSAAIGGYFGFYKKQVTTKDYLLGGKNMGIFPIAVSLSASYTSAITILGMPAEIYTYGSQYAVSCLGALAMAAVISRVYLPVFYGLQLSSCYEYLSLRFDRRVRLMITIIFLLDIFCFVPLAIYAPSIVFNLVTGINLKSVIIIVSIVCIFYTAIGGLKSVVWTDTIQYIMMNGAIFTILILGIPNEGGIKEIWKKSEESGRIEFFNMDPSFYTRETFWSVTFGLSMNWINSMGVHQTCVQRFLAVPSLSDAKKVLYIYIVAITTVKALCLFSGMIIFARYSGCDPLSAGIISKADQILPYYVMDTTRNIPGLPGLFIAGIFSAALSTMSTNLNTAGGVLYTDFIVNILPKNVSERTASRIIKGLVFLIGFITMMLAFYVERLGNILPLVVSFTGVTTGAMLGTFTLGLLFRRANCIGALTGCIFSILMMSWVMFGNKAAMTRGDIVYPFKELSVEDCDASLNVTINNTMLNSNNESGEEVFFLFKLSFMWYSLLGTVTTILVGLLVSHLTDPPNKNQIKPQHLSPVIRTAEEEELLKRTLNGEYTDVPITEDVK